MAIVKMNELLEVGAHFGHQTRRWNPNMKPFVYGVKNGIYIIDLQQTLDLFQQAYDYVLDAVGKGAKVLFVGTKRQAKDIIKEEANRCGMFYVNERWLGGMLTNFKTIKRSIDMLKQIEHLEAEGKLGGMTKKEMLMMTRKRVKLETYLSGIKEMTKPPEILFAVDVRRERIAIKEAMDLKMRIVAPVDTNCDPRLVNFPIPGNDDAMRAIRLYTSRIADAVLEGSRRFQDYQKEEEKRRLEDRARAAAEGETLPDDRPRRGKGPSVTKKEHGRHPSAGGQPAGGKPAGGQPAGRKPAGGQPAGRGTESRADEAPASTHEESNEE